MQTWITTIGHKPLAAVNTLWAVFRQENIGVINKVVVFYSKDMNKKLAIFKKWAEILFSEYQKENPVFETIEFPVDDISTFRILLKKTVNKTEGKIILDMTSGRKAMSALMLLIGDLYPGKVKKVYYTHLKNYDYTDFLYPTIPFNVSQIYNMLEN